jgi:hypothetical protein
MIKMDLISNPAIRASWWTFSTSRLFKGLVLK